MVARDMHAIGGADVRHLPTSGNFWVFFRIWQPCPTQLTTPGEERNGEREFASFFFLRFFRLFRPAPVGVGDLASSAKRSSLPPFVPRLVRVRVRVVLLLPPRPHHRGSRAALGRVGPLARGGRRGRRGRRLGLRGAGRERGQPTGELCCEG